MVQMCLEVQTVVNKLEREFTDVIFGRKLTDVSFTILVRGANLYEIKDGEPNCMG